MRSTLHARRENLQPIPWYREPLVWLLVLIPGSAVIMGIVAISLSVLSYDGLVVDDYYKRGLEINRELARDRAATAYALAATLDLDSHAGTTTARLSWNKGFRPPEALQFNLYHATQSGLDAQVSLQRLTLNKYRGKFPTLSPGDYHLQLEADDWRLTGTVIAPFDGQVKLAAHPSS
jgi:hypothetical protein